jgi:hypothetical protein
MTIRFFPLGIPFSSSYAVNASYATNLLGPTPTTASLAQFSIAYVGPSGSAAKTVTVSGFGFA